MSEEIRREGELRDQELEGVSGGALSAEWAQKTYCDKCAAKLNHRICSGGAQQLADYVTQNGRGAVYGWTVCPYLSRG